MPNDPYLLVKSEVEASLQTAVSQQASYRRILATLPHSAHTTSEDLEWSRDELKGTLSVLESDVDELESSVDVVTRDPARFGIDASEIGKRRQFVSRVRDETANMRRTITSAAGASSGRTARPPSVGNRYTPSASQYDDPEEDTSTSFPPNHANQQQQFYMESQDRMLDSIGSTVSTLKAQAGLMGREVLEQVGMLEDLESGVERSQSRLNRASKRMNEFVEKNKNSGSSWTIFLLTIVLSILLLVIVLL